MFTFKSKSHVDPVGAVINFNYALSWAYRDLVYHIFTGLIYLQRAANLHSRLQRLYKARLSKLNLNFILRLKYHVRAYRIDFVLRNWENVRCQILISPSNIYRRKKDSPAGPALISFP